MVDLFIVLAFVAWTLWSGFSARRTASLDPEHYFLAGRSLPGWQAAVSMAATQFAADTPLLVTGLIAGGGIYLNWRLWIYGIAFLLMGYLFAGSWRRAGVLTDAELTAVRYSGRGVSLLRGLKALYYGTVFNCAVLAMVLFAAARIAEVFLPWHLWLSSPVFALLSRWTEFFGFDFGRSLTGLDPAIYNTDTTISILLLAGFTLFYSATGGLRGVVRTDIAQFALAMLGTALFALFILLKEDVFFDFPQRIGELYSSGRAAKILSFSPPDDSLFWPFMILIGVQWFFQINSDGTGYLAQRMMACRSERDARFAAILFAWLQIVFRSLLWILIGVGLLLVYPFDADSLSSPSFAALREMTYVRGIQDLAPVGIRGMMLVGMLGALASTIDTHLNWGAGYWSNDLYGHLLCERGLKRKPSPHETVWVARLSNVLILLISLFVMTRLDSIQSAWSVTLLFGAGMGAVLVLRWLWERINLHSEAAAIAVSLVVAPVLLFSDTPLPEFLQVVIVGSAAGVAAIAITFFTPATDPDVIGPFFTATRPPGFWGNTARAVGLDPSAPRSELFVALRGASLAIASLFLTLIGSGSLLVQNPNHPLWFAALELALGLALIPFWKRDL